MTTAEAEIITLLTSWRDNGFTTATLTALIAAFTRAGYYET